jgi:hypothetical protein
MCSLNDATADTGPLSGEIYFQTCSINLVRRLTALFSPKTSRPDIDCTASTAIAYHAVGSF